MTEVEALRAENARLKTEVAQAKLAAAKTCYQGGAAAGGLLVAKDVEIARLREELERRRRPHDLPYDPAGNLWIGYCDLCNGQHCVTILDPEAKVERAPHRTVPTCAFEAAARAGAEYIDAHNELVEAGTSPARPEKARRLAEAWIALNKSCAALPPSEKERG